MKKFLLLTFTLSVLLSSCARYRDINVSGFEISGIEVLGLTSIAVECRAMVDNPTGVAFKMDKVQANLTKDEGMFATIRLMESGTVLPRSRDYLAVKCRIDIVDYLSILALGLDADKWKAEGFRINGSITVSGDNGMRKTLKIKDEPLGRFLGKVSFFK